VLQLMFTVMMCYQINGQGKFLKEVFRSVGSAKYGFFSELD